MDKVLGTLNGMEFTIGDSLLELSYLVAALLFVFGLKLLSHQKLHEKGTFGQQGAWVWQCSQHFYCIKTHMGQESH